MLYDSVEAAMNSSDSYLTNKAHACRVHAAAALRHLQWSAAEAPCRTLTPQRAEL
jgi:hypothetical protein